MTAAQIKSAAMATRNLPPDEIVSFLEIGSEGAVLQVGSWLNRGPRFLIARDGTIQSQDA